MGLKLGTLIPVCSCSGRLVGFVIRSLTSSPSSQYADGESQTSSTASLTLCDEGTKSVHGSPGWVGHQARHAGRVADGLKLQHGVAHVLQPCREGC